MFGFFRRKAKRASGSASARPAVLLPRRADFSFGLERLEDRRLLSAALNAACDPTTTTTTTTGTSTSAALVVTSVPASSLRFIATSSTTSTTTASTGVQSITLADAPSAVQSGLMALAQGVTIPTTQVVKQITRRDGTTIYTAAVSVNGKRSRITVDSDGNPLGGKIAFSDAPTVVQTGLQAQTTVTISDSQIVSIRERRGGTVVYSTAVNTGGRGKVLAVNADGTAVTRSGRTLTGGTTEAFGDATTAIQNGLQALAQGVTIGADQIIDIFTLPGGTSIYSALISINGEDSRIAVASDGTALEGMIQFGDAPAAVQTGLQTLDTAGTIPATQRVRISTRPGASASSIYSTSVELNNTATIIAVNASGTAVTVFGNGGGDGFGHHGGFGGGDFGHGGGVTDRTTVAYSTIPSAAQIGLQKLATGTTLAGAQQIEQSTLSDGTVVYATTITRDGRLVRIAVDADGNFRQGEIAFADAPSAVQTALQNLATGITIPNDQTVRINTLRDGKSVYSTAVTLSNVAKVIAVDSTGATVSDGSTFGVLGGGGGFGGGRHRRGGLGGGTFGGGGFGFGFGGLGSTTGTTTTTMAAMWRA